MPELPEVETTRRLLHERLAGRRIRAVVVRRRDLRWPIPRTIDRRLPGTRLERVERRAKYLILRTPVGAIISHLGMSGRWSEWEHLPQRGCLFGRGAARDITCKFLDAQARAHPGKPGAAKLRIREFTRSPGCQRETG